MALNYLLYQSRSTCTVTPNIMASILGTSRVNNSNAGLTGFLHYESGHFLQYLEGEDAPLEKCVERINQDSRHSDIEFISDGQAQKRYFPHWDMGAPEPGSLSLGEILDFDINSQSLATLDKEEVMSLIVFLSARSEEAQTLRRTA